MNRVCMSSNLFANYVKCPNSSWMRDASNPVNSPVLWIAGVSPAEHGTCSIFKPFALNLVSTQFQLEMTRDFESSRVKDKSKPD